MNALVFAPILGAVVLVALMFSGAFGAFASPFPSNGEVVCDLKGEITGNTLDLVALKEVRSINVLLDPANCHSKTLFDFSLFSADPTLPQASLIQGHVKLTVKLYSGSEIIKSQSVDLQTEIGNFAGSNFEEPLKFTSLNKGEKYTVKVYSSWNGSTVLHTKTFTV